MPSQSSDAIAYMKGYCSGNSKATEKSKMEFEKMEVDPEIIENYGPTLSLFIELLEIGHREKGLEFKDKTVEWMLKRIRQEETEFRAAIKVEDKCCEALDVSILWLLMAQKFLELDR